MINEKDLATYAKVARIMKDMEEAGFLHCYPKSGIPVFCKACLDRYAKLIEENNKHSKA